jgi:hypothetical protein
MHLYCLKKWIEQKTTKKQEGMVTIYKINKFECELCKEPYPLMYYKNNQKMVLYDIQRPEGTYIMLEQKNTHNKSTNNSFTLFLVDYDSPSINQPSILPPSLLPPNDDNKL